VFLRIIIIKPRKTLERVWGLSSELRERLTAAGAEDAARGVWVGSLKR
jgi:hypothetical protein